MRSDKHVTRGQLLEVAYEVAWRLEAYDSYGQQPKNAIRALRRRCPGFTDRQYENALAKARQLYEAACQLVQEHSAEVWRRFRRDQDVNSMFDTELKSRFPGFRESTLHQAVGMTFYYWHLR